MLTLTRMSGEKVVITVPPGWSGTFTVEVGRVTKQGPKSLVRLRFDPPPDVKIMREELTFKPQGGKS